MTARLLLVGDLLSLELDGEDIGLAQRALAAGLAEAPEGAEVRGPSVHRITGPALVHGAVWPAGDLVRRAVRRALHEEGVEVEER